MRCFDIALGNNGAAVTAYLQEDCTELEMVRWQKRPAILVIPGGGYSMVADREGEPIALKFAAMGYQAFVLRYTVKTADESPVLDALAAFNAIHENAEEWHIRTDAVCVTGYSAGGNLVLRLLKKLCGACPERMPNAMILGYPAVTGKGCIVQPMNGLEMENAMYAQFPPAFIWTTQEDEAVDCTESVRLWSLLNKNHVPAELHVYQKGRHGYSTGDLATGRPNAHVATWMPMCFDWLENMLNI